MEKLRYLQRRMLGITRDLRRLHFFDASLAMARAYADLDKVIKEIVDATEDSTAA